jgi:hypothetical protein
MSITGNKWDAVSSATCHWQLASHESHFIRFITDTIDDPLMGKQLLDLALKDKWDNVIPLNVHPFCSYLNPHKHHIGMLYIYSGTYFPRAFEESHPRSVHQIIKNQMCIDIQ